MIGVDINLFSNRFFKNRRYKMTRPWSQIVKADITPQLPAALPQVSFERKGLMPQQQSLAKSKRRFIQQNTHETRVAALSVFNKITDENLSESQIQVDSYDAENNLVILTRHRDLPPDQIPYVRGVAIDLNRGVILNYAPRDLPQITINQSLEKALKSLGVEEGVKLELKKGLQGLTLNFTKIEGKIIIFSNTNLNILNAKFDKYRVNQMLEETGVDYTKFFGEEKTSHYVHSFLLVHKVFAKAMKDATQKPFLTYIYSSPDSTLAEDNYPDIEERLKPMERAWGQGGIYVRPIMEFKTASEWLDHGVLSTMKIDEKIAYLRGVDSLESIPENIRQGEHLYVIAHNKDESVQEFIIESVSHNWRQEKVFPDLNFSVNFYDAVASPPFIPSTFPSLDSLRQEEKKLPILFWPSWLPSQPPVSEPVYDAFATLLLAAPFIRHQEVFDEYQAYLKGVDKLAQWLPQYSSQVVFQSYLSDNMKIKVAQTLDTIQKTLLPVLKTSPDKYKVRLEQVLAKIDSKVLRQIIILVNQF